MKKFRYFKMVGVMTIIMLLLASMLNLNISNAVETADYKVNLSDLTYTANGSTSELKKYTQNDLEAFLSDYNSGNLPDVYVTEFLFDGVSMVKTYDLDDFVESGNDVEVKTLDITVINVNKTGNYEFSGEITGGMIAVDTNNKSGSINLILNNVKIDTDSKKAPAILVYNEDITYTGCKVTIKTATGSKNYIEGGKLKKVSLIGSDELSNYTSKYSGDNQTNYTNYSKYYGVYTSEQINSILFAKVEADNEDLSDGDPYYFYKAAGAISSDIDLYFEGTGYLEVKSKNKEGIETKGNLTFSGGTGDYVIYAEDDCLNTTTSSSSNLSARNTLTIDVNSLTAIVDSSDEADEGDAIDSNGTLIINGGTIIAIAHPGQDAGIDSEKGTYINGGTVIATGDMYDQISNESKQSFMVLSFANGVSQDNLIALLNENDEAIMAYRTDRNYTNLVYSSKDLTNGTYYLYKDGSIEGTETNGLYTDITNYVKGTQQGYSSTGNQGGMNRGMPGGEQGRMPNDMSEEMQNGNAENENMQRGERPERAENTQNENFEERDNLEMPGDRMIQGDMTNNNTASNKEFTVNGISNQYSGIANLSSESSSTENAENTSSETTGNKNDEQTNQNSVNYYLIGAGIGGLAVILAIVAIVVFKKKK